MTDSRPLEKKRTVTFDKLLDAIALRNREPEALESLAGRLVRLEKRFDDALEKEVRTTAKGKTLGEIAQTLLNSVDPDKVEEASRLLALEEQRRDAAATLIKAAVTPLATNPALRQLLIKVQQTSEQVIDVITRDRVLFAGATQQTTQNAEQVTKSFRDYIENHKAEITALQLLYSRPYRHRLTEPMLKELERKLREEHAAWTEDNLWDAFASVAPKKVKGRSQAGRFADLVALVRFALERVNLFLEPIKAAKRRDDPFQLFICVVPDLVYTNCRPLSEGFFGVLVLSRDYLPTMDPKCPNPFVSKSSTVTPILNLSEKIFSG